ncbi:hypothetical protein JG688_00014529 [Phytophthora aleatoria]|uniref:RxLR effector protein n=1 Tax=Phytophthora aleatoria TaxID=2496075 RepID=A0A8J5IJL4_9STRA|nr:hypothetical protein JG688_00014529 [Phytophthora aleatoria]
MLRHRKTTDVTRTSAKLEEFQVKTWIDCGKSTDDIFKLRVDQKGDALLKSPVLNIWQSYVRQLNKNPDKVLFSEMKTRSNDEELAKVLAAAKNNRNTVFIAERLENIHLQYFQKNGSTAENVFILLRLDKEGDRVLESPIFSTWDQVKREKSRPGNALDPAEKIRRHVFGGNGC